MAFIRTYSKKPQVADEASLIANGIQPERVRFFDLKEMVANKAAALLWGRDIKIDMKIDGYEVAKKRLREIIQENNLQSIMYEMEKRVSALGTTFITVEYFNSIPTFALAEQTFPQGYSKQLAVADKAVIWKRHTFDMIEVPTLEIWTTKRVRRRFLRTQQRVLLPYLTEEERKIDSNLNPPEVWNHNLGVLPVFQVKNKPHWGLAADPDDSATQLLQIKLDKLTEAFYKELEKNQTRIITSMNEAELANLGKDGSGIKNLINDYIFHLGNRSDMIKDPVNILMGDPKIENYIKGIKEIVNMYFNSCGYSNIFSEDTGGEQSATQTFNSNKLDMETTRSKRQQRIKLLRNMIKMAIMIDKKFGKGDIYPDLECIDITIPENIAVSVDDTLRRVQAEVPLGTMSKEQAISLMNDIDRDAADKELDKIREEQEKDMDIEMKKEKQFAENEGFKNNKPMDKGMTKKKKKKNKKNQKFTFKHNNGRWGEEKIGDEMRWTKW